MRLIDEAEVIKRMHETMDYQDLYSPTHFEMCMRDVDAIEVVRCKDCKQPHARLINGMILCGTKLVDEDFFCALGKRK